jgi:hypothetical protein
MKNFNKIDTKTPRPMTGNRPGSELGGFNMNENHRIAA